MKPRPYFFLCISLACTQQKPPYQIQIEPENQELWHKLQQNGEKIGKGCLFGGMTVNDAIEKESFVRSGNFASFNKSTEVIKPVTQNETWVNKIKSDKTSSIAR